MFKKSCKIALFVCVMIVIGLVVTIELFLTEVKVVIQLQGRQYGAGGIYITGTSSNSAKRSTRRES